MSWMRLVAMNVQRGRRESPHYKAQDNLVRTVGPCAQRRVALMPQAIATARDTLSAQKRRAFREAC